MATYYDHIIEEQATLIRKSPVFFVASADPGLGIGPDNIGPVNVSPKGGLPLTILNSNLVAYLDYPGSGNEMARHAEAGGPCTIMVCSFDEDSAIVRLYGDVRVTSIADSSIADDLLRVLPTPPEDPLRQVVELSVTRTATSCGFGVPMMDLVRDRGKDDRGRNYFAPKDAPPVEI